MPKKTKILPHKWYIVEAFGKNQNGNMQILRAEFDKKKEAQIAIKVNYPNRQIYYDVIKGRQAIEFCMEFKKRFQKMVIKYDYPETIGETKQDRKSFRTKYRRHRRGFKNIKTSEKYKKSRRRRKRNRGDN